VRVGGSAERDQDVLAALGRVLKEGRRRRSLTQRAVEELSGVDQTAISRMERGATAGIALVRFARVIEVLAGPSLFGRCPHAHLCPWSTGLTLEPPRTPWSGRDSPYDEYGYVREGHGLLVPDR
jgi:hypothetical protein